MKTKSVSVVPLRAHLLGLFLGMNAIAVLAVVLFSRVLLEQLGETAFPLVVSEAFWICMWLFLAVLTVTAVVWAGESLLPRIRAWYNTIMRITLTLALFPFVALGATVSELPQSAYADTEVSTNIAFVVDRSEISRIEFTVALVATPTNNVEVAIGTDENGDGNLSVEEAAYTFGYDCGNWFVRDQSKSEVLVVQRNLSTCSAGQTEEKSNHHCTTSTADFDLSSHTFILKTKKLDESWNLAKVTRRGFGSVCELVKVEGRLPGFKLEVR